MPTHTSSCEYYWQVHEQQRFPSEFLLAFTIPWWTAGGVGYGSHCFTVVVGSYNGLPSTWYTWVFKGKIIMPYHCITAQRSPKMRGCLLYKLESELFCATFSQWLSGGYACCHSYWNWVHIRHNGVHLAVWWCRSCTGLFLLQTSNMQSRKWSGRWPGNKATLIHCHVNIPDCWLVGRWESTQNGRNSTQKQLQEGQGPLECHNTRISIDTVNNTLQHSTISIRLLVYSGTINLATT